MEKPKTPEPVQQEWPPKLEAKWTLVEAESEYTWVEESGEDELEEMPTAGLKKKKTMKRVKKQYLSQIQQNIAERLQKQIELNKQKNQLENQLPKQTIPKPAPKAAKASRSRAANEDDDNSDFYAPVAEPAPKKTMDQKPAQAPQPEVQ